MRFEVRDFASWYGTFLASPNVARRQELGLASAELYRDATTPNLIFAVLQWDHLDGARAYIEDPQLLARMADAGVVGVPEIRFVQRV